MRMRCAYYQHDTVLGSFLGRTVILQGRAADLAARVVGSVERGCPPEHIAALAPEQAMRLMQLAALDVKRWVENERLRERAL